MTVTEKVTDATALLAVFVDQTRTILEALEHGRPYLRQHHPTAAGDLADLLEQMRSTVAGALSVTRAVTEFSQTGGTADQPGATAPSFGERLTSADTAVSLANTDISRLKGSSSRIRQLRDKLEQRSREHPWWALLGDQVGQRAGDLSHAMNRLYLNDDAMAAQVEKVLVASRAVLQAARKELGSGSFPTTESVASADKLIREHAEAFRPAADALRDLRDRLGQQIAALDMPSSRPTAN